MAQKYKQRRRTTRSRTAGLIPQKWPETMEELNALAPSNPSSDSVKPVLPVTPYNPATQRSRSDFTQFSNPAPAPDPTLYLDEASTTSVNYKPGMVEIGAAAAQQIMEKRNKELQEWGRLAAIAPALGLPVPPAPNWSGKASSGTAGKHNSGTGAAVDIGVIVAQQFEANKNQYGINIDALLKAAESQLNTKEGANNDNPYGTWYKDPNQEWCAQFASWCANQIGCLNTDISKSSKGIPINEGTGHFAEDYKKMNRLADGYQYTNDIKNAYKPKAGDYVFFGWGHTGIVVAFDEANGYVYTIEGNTAGNNGGNGNGVYYKRRSYKNGDIKGYGINGGTSYGTIPNLSKNSE